MNLHSVRVLILCKHHIGSQIDSFDQDNDLIDAKIDQFVKEREASIPIPLST